MDPFRRRHSQESSTAVPVVAASAVPGPRVPKLSEPLKNVQEVIPPEQMRKNAEQEKAAFREEQPAKAENDRHEQKLALYSAQTN